MGLIGLKIPAAICRDLPGKDFFLFYIAPLNPVLKDEAFGEQAGQTFAFAGLHLFDRITVNPNIMNGRPSIRGMRIQVSLILN